MPTTGSLPDARSGKPTSARRLWLRGWLGHSCDSVQSMPMSKAKRALPRSASACARSASRRGSSARRRFSVTSTSFCSRPGSSIVSSRPLSVSTTSERGTQSPEAPRPPNARQALHGFQGAARAKLGLNRGGCWIAIRSRQRRPHGRTGSGAPRKSPPEVRAAPALPASWPRERGRPHNANERRRSPPVAFRPRGRRNGHRDGRDDLDPRLQRAVTNGMSFHRIVNDGIPAREQRKRLAYGGGSVAAILPPGNSLSTRDPPLARKIVA